MDIFVLAAVVKSVLCWIFLPSWLLGASDFTSCELLTSLPVSSSFLCALSSRPDSFHLAIMNLTFSRAFSASDSGYVWWRRSVLQTASVRIPVFCCLTYAHLYSAAAEWNHKTLSRSKSWSTAGGATSAVAPDVSINLWHNIVSHINAANVESHLISHFVLLLLLLFLKVSEKKHVIFFHACLSVCLSGV